MSQTPNGATAPAIEGLTFVRWLGGGGFADVYLYNQAAPQRQVAVKVLRDPTLSPTVVRAFQAEADAMARLEHPHIVPVYATGMTKDRRPYIVMMYYSQPSLAAQIRTAPLSVPATLRLGVQLGAAIETAHRAGILHRDIKPANVLTSAYGKPGLADFGIAGRIADRDDQGIGVSIPWAPPELLARSTPASVQSDLYSLGATLWHALVGRSPFQVPGGDNSPGGLMMRIRTSPPPRIDGRLAPADLDALIHRLMAPEPEQRPQSARAVIAELQSVEQRLGYPATVAELISERWGHTDSTDVTDVLRDEYMDSSVTHLVTELLGSAGQERPLAALPSSNEGPTRLGEDRTILRPLAPPVGPGATDPTLPPAPRPRRRAALAMSVGALALVLAGASTGVALRLTGLIAEAPLAVAAPSGREPSAPRAGSASPEPTAPSTTAAASAAPSPTPLAEAAVTPTPAPAPATTSTIARATTTTRSTTTTAPAPATTTTQTKTTTAPATTTTIVKAPVSLTISEGARGNNSWCISSACRAAVLTGRGFTPGDDYTISLHFTGGTCPAHGTSGPPSVGTADSSGRFTVSGTSFFDCAGATVWATTVESGTTVSSSPITWS